MTARLLTALVGIVLVGPACKRGEPALLEPERGGQAAPVPAASPGHSPGGATDAAASRDRYTVRGLIRGLVPGKKPPSITILHQAIPGFRNREGEVTGMMSMAMPFAVGGSVEIGGLAVGDKVEFTFVVDWDASDPARIERLLKLAADTEIKFGE